MSVTTRRAIVAFFAAVLVSPLACTHDTREPDPVGSTSQAVVGTDPGTLEPWDYWGGPDPDHKNSILHDKVYRLTNDMWQDCHPGGGDCPGIVAANVLRPPSTSQTGTSCGSSIDETAYLKNAIAWIVDAITKGAFGRTAGWGTGPSPWRIPGMYGAAGSVPAPLAAATLACINYAVDEHYDAAMDRVLIIRTTDSVWPCRRRSKPSSARPPPKNTGAKR